MQRIIVLNSKGGCGKTTIATNLASLYANDGYRTALLDYDPQGSSMKWLSLRPQENSVIYGVAAHKQHKAAVTSAWHKRILPGTERVIIDSPAGVAGLELYEYVRQVDTVIVPVLPSPIDIYSATRFIEDLLLMGKVRQQGVRVGVVANRIKKNTLVYQSLERFLKTLKLPFITSFRDTQHYVRAAARGVGIGELWDRRAERDRLSWQPLLDWLEGVEEQHQSAVHQI